MGKDSFLLRGEWQEAFNALSDEDAGKLIKAVYEYNITGEDPQDLPPMAKVVFLMARSFFDESAEKYRRICERNKSNGDKGGRPKEEEKPKKPSGLFGLSEETEEKPKKPSGVYYDSDYEYDSEYDYDPSVPEGGEKRACARVPAPSKAETVKKPGENFVIQSDEGEIDTSDEARCRYLPENVNLTYSQTEQLRKRFPAQWYEMIDHLSSYMIQQGKTYADHMAVILDWAKEDGAEEGRRRPPYLKASEEESRVSSLLAYRRGAIAKWETEQKEAAE